MLLPVMINVSKHIDHWRSGAAEDLAAARELISNRRTRHGLFFAHLAIEKLLKATVTQNTGEVAPKTHALLRLAEIANLVLSDEQRGFLGEFDRYQIEGRYPEFLEEPPGQDEADAAFASAEEMIEWLKSQL
jgi:HEPN domain-containing protein